MFGFLNSKCAMCKRKAGPYRLYRTPEGEKVKYCAACTVYAERRAYERLQ